MFLKSIALLMLVLITEVYGQNVLRWRKIDANGSPPSPRQDSAVGYDPNSNGVILFGGRSSNGVFSDTWLLDISSSSWKKVNFTVSNSKRIPNEIYGAVCGNARDGFLVAFGRGAVKDAIYDDIYRFDFNTTKWQQVQVNGKRPQRRYFAIGAVNGEHLYTSHGRAKAGLLSDTFRFSTSTGSWEEIHDDVNQYSPTAPHSRYAQSGTVMPGGNILMFGGCLSGEKSVGPCPSSDSWSFDSLTKKWKSLESCASARMHSTLVMLPNSTESSSVAVLYGGLETSKSTIKVFGKAMADQVATFDSQSGKWQQKRVQQDPKYGLPELRYGQSVTATTTGIVLFGGVSVKNGQLLNDVWILEGDVTAARNSEDHGNCGGSQVTLITLHGIFMFVAWGIMLQISGFVARYLKSKGKIWYNLHRGLSVTGLVLAIVGLSLSIVSIRGTHFSTVHGAIGLDIMLAGIYQPINAIFRPAEPKEGEKPKLWRRIWQISHKFTGRLSLLLALINISLGLFVSLAHKAIWITWFVYIGVVVVAYIVAEIYSRKQAEGKIDLTQVAHPMEARS